MQPRVFRALLVAILAGVPCHSLVAQGGATATGIHSKDAFCTTMIQQFDLMSAYTKSPALGADRTRRAKYFADQKALNATLLRTAPASIKSDVTLLTKDANDSYDAQLGADRAKVMAAIVRLRSPAHLAAAKRANDYCGIKLAAAK
jgi:hypothetical protein